MKRFTETLKWQNPWFRKLTPEAKLLWLWLVDHCDPAGIIEPDFALASFQIGVEIDEEVVAELGSRIVRLPSGKDHIPAFIGFQYGQLSRSCRAQNKVFDSLERHGLLHIVGESSPSPHTLSDTLSNRVSNTQQEEEEEEEEEIKEEGCGEKPPLSTIETIVSAYPRREATAECLATVAKHIAEGENPETILAGTRAIASAIAQLPGKHLGKYVPGAARFFRDKRWSDDPATWLRQGSATGTTSDGAKLELGSRRPASVTKIPYQPAK
jgi:hypothetical protein